jgi:hypothetical protein
MTLTESIVARLIMLDRHHRNFCLPRYTPIGWWECDVFELTPAGYFREYEIKLTVADFKADVAKSKVVGEVSRNKHLEIRQPFGPRQFWYVVPDQMVQEVPEWAGLITVQRSPSGRLYEQEVKRAPFLHQELADPKMVAHARSVCYWRFHNLLDYRAVRASGVQTAADVSIDPNP